MEKEDYDYICIETKYYKIFIQKEIFIFQKPKIIKEKEV